MKLSAKILLTIRKFFKKYGKYVISILIVWIVIIGINTYLKNRPKEIIATNTYTPDIPVIDLGGTVPKKEQEEVKEIIDTYFKYCNNKQYKNAYDMLSKDCQEYLYNGSIADFKQYIDSVFTKTKIYNIQNYSNIDDIYIYNIRILDDIMSTGTTGGYDTYQEKIAIVKEDGKKKIANQGYIGKKIYNNVVGEDDYIKVKVQAKNMSYTREEYQIEITNKTSGYILIGNGMNNNEVTLNLIDQSRTALDLINNNIIIKPGSTQTYYILFDKFYDDGKEPSELNLNLIRVFGTNIDNQTALKGETSEASKVYSLNIPLK